MLADMTQTPRRQNGSRIRQLRIQRGIKTGLFAKRLGVARSTLTKAENGRGLVSWELLHRIAAALDVPVTELLSDKGRREHAELTALTRKSA